ncbi:MAG TPA: cytochrome c [Candidatus Binataceae bacterium]|nr:cytochrome c [Candidatus Binataceae bacterium]
MNHPYSVVSRIAALLWALALGACNGMPGRPRPSQRPVQPSAVSDFAQLYGENCAGCHGVDGRFGAAMALDNPVLVNWLGTSVLRDLIARGRPGTAMPGFSLAAGGTLTDRQIAILVEGISQRWGQGSSAVGAPVFAGAEGNPRQGRQDYLAFCASCHGPDGRGGATPGAIVNPDYLTLVSDRHLAAVIVAGRPDLGHPNWRGYSAGHPLDATQVTDIVTWLAAQRPPALGSSDVGAQLSRSSR